MVRLERGKVLNDLPKPEGRRSSLLRSKLRTKWLLLAAVLAVAGSIAASGGRSGTATAAGADGAQSSRAQGAAKINSLQTVIDDMRLPHEGRPQGVPDSYDWVRGPTMGRGNHPPATWRALTAWGQLYEDAKGNPARNTRVEIRRMRTYVLSKRDGKWRRVQSSPGVAGAAYREDFSEDINKKADVRQEPEGGISVTAGGGYNFHFWPSGGRVTIDPRDIGGVFVTVEARLIVGDSREPDDRQRARYLLSVGADYWLSRSAKWDHFKTNDAVGLGRFKYVRATWQAFNFTTLSAKQLRRNPPPLE